MENESINIIFGAILLVLVINSTILWSVVFSIHGPNSLNGGEQEFTNLTSQKIVAGSPSKGSGVSLSGTGAPFPALSTTLTPRNYANAPAATPNGSSAYAYGTVAPFPVITQTAQNYTVAPATTLDRSGVAVSGMAIPNPVPNVQPALNRAVALADSPLNVNSARSRLPSKTVASYVTIEIPETPENDKHQMLQHSFSRRNFDDYITVYSLINKSLPVRLPRISMNLANPPLVIDYNVSPMSITDHKYIEYKTGKTMHKENLSVHRFYEDAWFRIVVRNKDTGDIVEEDGIGREYFFENQREVVVWSRGNYSVEFEGEDVTIKSLTIKVRQDGIVPG